MGSYYIGLMSGTSMDGIDAALVRFPDDSRIEVIAGQTTPLPDQTVVQLRSLIESGSCTLDKLGRLDRALGEAFAAAAQGLIRSTNTRRDDVIAIGSHGQTIRHTPHGEHAFTMQIGDPNIIAARTGVTTVADLRRRDMAVGGQGAPLAPGFHAAVFSAPGEKRVVINIGGISNISVLDHDQRVTGFDTGPGNGLIDAWCHQHHDEPFDRGGAWAATGNVNMELLDRLIADDYFRAPPPKSTGREYFNLPWLTGHLLSLSSPPSPEDVQATLVELTVRSIADAIRAHATGCARCFVCGGGAFNGYLMGQLRDALAPMPVESTEQVGVPPDLVEAAAFAWLARQTLNGAPGNKSAVTGATQNTVLGGIYPANKTHD